MLNSNDPQNFVWLNLLAVAHLFAGDGANALAAAVRAQKMRPSWRPVQETLACCYATVGRLAEARSSRELMSEMENPPGDALEPLRQRNPHWQERLAELLQQIPSNPLQTPQRS